mmetsp:Transcript_16694/g.19334  ORF Transcript_16694/g.19334 Transcript_16694/m.19334 type:complete len:219 (-) Transcript_16694:257-913(-)
MLLPVVGERFVERRVLLLRDLLWLSHPKRLGLVELLVDMGDLLDLLFLLVLLLLLFLYFWLVAFAFLLLCVLLVLVLIIRFGDFLLVGLLAEQFNGEANELGVFLDEILDAFLLQVLVLVFLQVEDDLGASLQWLAVVWDHSEGAAGVGLPSVLVVIVRLADHGHFVRDEVARVEADSELPDHGNIRALRHGLHERLSAGLCDGSQVVDELTLGHGNA